MLRRELECRFDYSGLSAYRSIDKYHDGCINTHNLGAFLRSCGHYAQERELIAIVRRIDTDGDARLTCSEFSEYLRAPCGSGSSLAAPMSSPCRPRSAERTSYSSPLKTRCCSPHRSPVRACPVYPPSPYKATLRPYEEDKLVGGLKEMVGIERDLESAKTSCALSPDFNLYDTFKMFDRDNNGYVCSHEIRDCYNALGVYPTHD